MGRRSTAVLVFAASLAQAAPASADNACPQILRDAHRLVLVTADGMTTSTATAQTFRRASPAEPWQASEPPAPARIGRAGMGWAHTFRHLRRAREPLKVEGDKRSPAGVYRVGASFGFTAARRRDHLRIRAETVCVDDVRSPAYNTITSQAAAGPGVRVERMRANHRYREGLLVDYPTNAAARAGSCIFIHVWETPGHPTAGCIALAEARVKALQEFAAPGAVIAILPQQAAGRLSPCLPREIAGVN